MGNLIVLLNYEIIKYHSILFMHGTNRHKKKYYTFTYSFKSYKLNLVNSYCKAAVCQMVRHCCCHVNGMDTLSLMFIFEAFYKLFFKSFTDLPYSVLISDAIFRQSDDIGLSKSQQ